MNTEPTSFKVKQLKLKTRLFPPARNPANRKQRIRARRIGSKNYFRKAEKDWNENPIIETKIETHQSTGLRLLIIRTKNGDMRVSIL